MVAQVSLHVFMTLDAQGVPFVTSGSKVLVRYSCSLWVFLSTIAKKNVIDQL